MKKFLRLVLLGVSGVGWLSYSPDFLKTEIFQHPDSLMCEAVTQSGGVGGETEEAV